MLLLLQLVVGLLVVPVLVEPVVEQPGFAGLAVEQHLLVILQRIGLRLKLPFRFAFFINIAKCFFKRLLYDNSYVFAVIDGFSVPQYWSETYSQSCLQQ